MARCIWRLSAFLSILSLIIGVQAQTPPDVAWTASGVVGFITRIEASKDGRFLISGGFQHLQIWQLEPRSCVHYIYTGRGNYFKDAAITADSSKVILATSTRIDLYDLTSGLLLRSSASNTANRIAVHPSGEHFAVGARGLNRNTEIWDLNTFTRIGTLPGHEGSVSDMQYSSSGRYLATVSASSFDAKITDTLTGLTTFQLPRGRFVSALPYGDRFALNAESPRIGIYEPTGMLVRELSCVDPGQYDQFSDVSFSPSGERMASILNRQEIHVWDLTSTSALPSGVKLMDQTSNEQVEFSTDGTKLYHSGSWPRDYLRMEHADLAGNAVDFPDVEYIKAVFNWDSTSLITCGYYAKKWDLETGSVLNHWPQLGGDGGGHYATVSADHQFALIADFQKLSLYRLPELELLKVIDLPLSPTSITISPDNSYFAAFSDSATYVFDLPSGRLKRTIAFPRYPFAYSPNGRFMATITYPGLTTAHIFDIDTGLITRTFSGHNRGIVSMAFSPDGSKLVVFDGEYSVWDIATGTLSSRFPVAQPIPSENLSSFEISPDGRHLVTYLWQENGFAFHDLSTGLRSALVGPVSGNAGLGSFSPDGEKFVFRRGDGSLIVASNPLADSKTSVRGQFSLDGFSGSYLRSLLIVEVWQSGQMIERYEVLPNFDGKFRVWPLVLGDVVLRARTHSSLWEAVGVTLQGRPLDVGNWLVPNGDADGSNEVDSADFGMLIQAYGSEEGRVGFEPSVDFDGDREIGPGDFAILARNYGLVGD